MPKKPNGSGNEQNFDETNGRYAKDNSENSNSETIDNHAENGYNNSITKDDYGTVSSLRMEKVKQCWKKLQQRKSVRTYVTTWNYIYEIELHNDDDYSFEILKKEPND